jgi:hypothetical protein
MANFVYIMKKGMDVCAGGHDQTLVPEGERTEQPLTAGAYTRPLLSST